MKIPSGKVIVSPKGDVTAAPSQMGAMSLRPLLARRRESIRGRGGAGKRPPAAETTTRKVDYLIAESFITYILWVSKAQEMGEHVTRDESGRKATAKKRFLRFYVHKGGLRRVH